MTRERGWLTLICPAPMTKIELAQLSSKRARAGFGEGEGGG